MCEHFYFYSSRNRQGCLLRNINLALKSFFLSESRNTIKGFALCILCLHGSCNNLKGIPCPLPGFVHFFCVAQKKWTKEKGAAARGLSGEFLAPALPDAAVARCEALCANFLFACEAPRWRFSYRLSVRLRRTI